MSTWVAIKYNPFVRDFDNRTKANHKTGNPIVCAAMRKLLRIFFAALKKVKSNRSFTRVREVVLWWVSANGSGSSMAAMIFNVPPQ
ncbi:MAG: hypothetical protein ACU843_15825 [Gammaproteobacteria bacterium]